MRRGEVQRGGGRVVVKWLRIKSQAIYSLKEGYHSKLRRGKSVKEEKKL